MLPLIKSYTRAGSLGTEALRDRPRLGVHLAYETFKITRPLQERHQHAGLEVPRDVAVHDPYPGVVGPEADDDVGVGGDGEGVAAQRVGQVPRRRRRRR